MAITLAELCPEIQATVIELPSVTPITEVIVKESEVAHRVTVASQDVVAGPITGTYDVAVMRSFIQALPMEQARQAINNVGEVIEPNGMIYIIGAMLDNTRLTPHETVLSNLTSLNSYEDAQAYTEQEHEDWLAEAGFTDFTRVVLPNSHSSWSIRGLTPSSTGLSRGFNSNCFGSDSSRYCFTVLRLSPISLATRPWPSISTYAGLHALAPSLASSPPSHPSSSLRTCWIFRGQMDHYPSGVFSSIGFV